MTVLLTGGAGYIGAHVGRLLQQRGTPVVVVDNLATGSPRRIGSAPLVRCDLASDSSVETLGSTIREHAVTSVIHVAARKQVGESMSDPEGYYRSNIGGLANVLSAAAAGGIKSIVFSSSAAVYGNPTDSPVSEAAATLPMNPYGETKLAGEWLLARAVAAHRLNATSLRYFNVAGSGWDDLGDPFALNLLTIAISRISDGERPIVFGDSYPTPDGSCIRDYVHVLDLAEAHLAALDALQSGQGTVQHRVYNVGTGRGTSVLEMLAELQRVSKSSLEPLIVDARPGDPATVVGDSSLILSQLGWSARRSLHEIVESAWDAHRHEQRIG